MSNSTADQKAKGKLVNRGVIQCVSTLVYELAQKWEHFEDYEDDLLHAFIGNPDYEEAAKAEDWESCTYQYGFYRKQDDQYFLSVNLNERGMVNVSVHLTEEPGQGSNAPCVWSFDGTADEASEIGDTWSFTISDPGDLLEYLQENDLLPMTAELYDHEDCNYEVADVESWQELCEDESVLTEDYESEVYEHWSITEWLADKLEAHGEKVIRDLFGMTVWCRTCSGQAILLDSVIDTIAEEMKILEGQSNHKHWVD